MSWKSRFRISVLERDALALALSLALGGSDHLVNVQ
jgi:hypothetical protein